MEQRLVEATPGAVIDIFRAGTHVAQPGGAHPGLEALGFAAGDFAIDQQAKPFGVAEIGSRDAVTGPALRITITACKITTALSPFPYQT